MAGNIKRGTLFCPFPSCNCDGRGTIDGIINHLNKCSKRPSNVGYKELKPCSNQLEYKQIDEDLERKVYERNGLDIQKDKPDYYIIKTSNSSGALQWQTDTIPTWQQLEDYKEKNNC